MAKSSILIVDDEKHIRRSLEMICAGEGYRVQTASNGQEAMTLLGAEAIDLVLLDIVMPETDGISLLEEIRQANPAQAVIMVSGQATIENAVLATKAGAYDFIEKPISKQKLLISIENALGRQKLQDENRALREQMANRYEMVGESQSMQQIVAQLMKVAPTNGRVLILGESGTGKELIARAIHKHSNRCEEAFIKVNCAAIPEQLIESELFGAVKGAFTGAVQTREGKFSLADRGTLFLDEVGDMSLQVQAKVLRVLQEGEFEKVGGQETEKVDVRVLAATNKDLQTEVRQRQFREDLFFRLNVVPIQCPALRQRREDIPLLVKRFADDYCQENGLRPKELAPAAITAMSEYDWPGNIRELKNMIERLMIMGQGDVVELTDLPTNIRSPGSVAMSTTSNLTLKETKERFEREHIVQTLENTAWNISQAARILDIDRTNLHKKIKQYGIEK